VTSELPDEFDWIAALRPLTRGEPAALGLMDDAAVLPARPGADLVIWGSNPTKLAAAEAKLGAFGRRVLVSMASISAAWLTMPSPYKSPAASHSSSPGVRIVVPNDTGSGPTAG